MGITCKGKVKGKREVEVFLNSSSDYVVLPRRIAEVIIQDLLVKSLCWWIGV